MSLRDNFDTYLTGALSGQGSWTGDSAFTVENTVTFAGTQAVTAALPAAGIYRTRKSFANQAAGVQTFYMRGTTTTSRGIVVLAETTDSNNNIIIYWCVNAGKLSYWSGGSLVDFATVVADQWYKIDVEWRTSPSHTFRIRLDNGTWSSWVTPYATWTTGLDVVALDITTSGTGNVYWDAFEDPNAITTQFVDTFNRANNTALGGTWVDNTGDFQIQNNSAYCASAPASSYDGQTLGTGNYSVGASMAYHNSVGNPGYQWTMYLYARASGVTKFDNCYFIYVVNNSGTDLTASVYIGKRVSGALTWLKNPPVKMPCVAGRTYNYKIEVNGTRIRAFQNGVPLVEVSDSSFSAEGDHGMRAEVSSYFDDYIVDTNIAPYHNTGVDGQYVAVRPGGTTGQPYFSTDYGQTWALETIVPGDNSLYWSQFSYTHDGSIVVASSFANVGKRGRIYKKVSGTWLEMQPLGNADYTWKGISISGDGKKIIAIQNNGISISQNTGSTWTNTAISNGTNCAINRDGTKMMYVTDRIYYSNNSGSSFTELQPQGNTTRTWGRPWMNLNGDKIVVFSASDSANQGRVWYTNNEGSSWTEIRPFNNGQDIDRQWAGFISNENMTRMLAGGVNYAYLWAYKNGAWSQQSPGGTINGQFGVMDGSSTGELQIIGYNSSGSRLYRRPNEAWEETRPIGDVGDYWPVVATNHEDGLFPVEKVYNVTSQARISKLETKTADAKARVKYTGVTKTVTAKAHIHNFVATGYSHFLNLTVDYTKVWDTDHTNFTVLVKGTYSFMRSVSNGGHVENANGYDIIFTTTDSLYRLDHQIETYDPTTGDFTAWVRIPTLSSTVDTSFRMYYGNPTISTPTETTAVWDSNHKAVYLHNTDPTTTILDKTASPANMTTFGGMNATNLVAGNYGKADNFIAASSQYGRTATGVTKLDFTTNDYTLEAWVNMTTFHPVTDVFPIWKGDGATFIQYSLGITETGRLKARAAPGGGGTVTADLVDAISLGTWYHLACVRTGTTMSLYVNGVLKKTGAWASMATSTLEAWTGYNDYAPNQIYLNGKVGEVRMSSSARSAGWLKTEYYAATDAGFITYSGEHISINVTVTARARIQKTIDRTVTSKARVKYTGVNKSISAKANIKPPGGQKHIMGDDCLVY